MYVMNVLVIEMTEEGEVSSDYVWTDIKRKTENWKKYHGRTPNIVLIHPHWMYILEQASFEASRNCYRIVGLPQEDLMLSVGAKFIVTNLVKGCAVGYVVIEWD
jgi:hypothetical protein